MAADIDDIDRRILRSLNQNARKSYRDIARDLGVALSTVSAHVKKLEEAGVIQGYVPVVDAAKLGYDLNVIVGVKIAHGKLIDVQEKIAKKPNAYGVYDVTGEWDSVVLARFRDREELNDFVKDISALPHVERTFTQLVLNTMKEERKLPV